MSSFQLKMAFAFTLVIGLFIMGGAIAVFKVEEASSYGLHDILHTFEILATGFSVWAFTHEDAA